MVQILFFAANSILPIVLMLALGYFLKRIGLMQQDFMAKANSLFFRVFLPILIFCNIYDYNGLGDINWGFIVYVFAARTVLFFLGLLIARLFVKQQTHKGVVAQCVHVSNFAIIGFALASTINGTAGLQLAAIVAAATAPYTNVLQILSYTVFSPDPNHKNNFKTICHDVIHNPMFIGAMLGMLILIIRSFIPTDETGAPVFTIAQAMPFLYTAVSDVSAAASPLFLIVIGGMLEFTYNKEDLKDVALATSFRILFSPILGIAGAILCMHMGLISCGSAEFAVLIAMFAAPAALASAIMAIELGQDGHLARQIIIWTHLLSIFSIFAYIVFCTSFGYLDAF